MEAPPDQVPEPGDQAPNGAEGDQHDPPRSLSPAAEPPGEQALPAHRVALRALLGGPCGGLAFALVFLLIVALGDSGGLKLFPFVWGGATVGVGFLLLGEGVARQFSPAVRPAVLAVFALLAGSVVTCAVLWLATVLDGQTPIEALDKLAEVIARTLSQPEKSLPGVIGPLFPVLALGSVRSRPRPWPLAAQAGVGAVSGLATFLLCVACWGSPGRHELVMVTAAFLLSPAAGVLGLAPLPWLEALVLRALGQGPEERE